MSLILLLGWVLRISSPALQQDGVALEIARSLHQILDDANLGPVPGWTVLLIVGCFYGVLGMACLHPDRGSGELAFREVHV